jgi:hypothetical protein
VAKRFTDTDKWKMAWYRRLGAEGRDLWNYLHDNCDFAGFFEVDCERVSFELGFSVDMRRIQSVLNGKYQMVSEDRIFLPAFIEFQYGQLRDNNTVHQSVIRMMRKHGLAPEVESGFSSRPSAVLARLSAKKKNEVMREDGFACSYCGMKGDGLTLVVDHIIPRIKGGDNADDNLTTACIACNSKKADLSAADFIERHALDALLSPVLRSKLDTISPNKPLNGAKDKEQDKNKDRDKEQEEGGAGGNKSPDALPSSLPPSPLVIQRKTLGEQVDVLELCYAAWLETLAYYKAQRPQLAPAEQLEIARAVQRQGSAKAVLYALRGARYEPKSESYDPGKFLKINRVLDPEHFNRFMNLGIQAEHKRAEGA